MQVGITLTQDAKRGDIINFTAHAKGFQKGLLCAPATLAANGRYELVVPEGAISVHMINVLMPNQSLVLMRLPEDARKGTTLTFCVPP